MHFHIEGLPPFDGDHEIDFSHFTNRELHTIKQLSGVRVDEIEEAFEALDNDLLVALAVIALTRAGHAMGRTAIDRIWDAQVGQVKLVGDPSDEEEADARPPGEQKPSEPESGSSASGPGSPSDGESSQVIDLRATGSRDSETTADSGQASSAS